MNRWSQMLPMCVMMLCLAGPGCIGGSFESLIFPVWPANYFDEQPTDVGPYAIEQYSVRIENGADGQPFDITMFRPTDAEGPLPAFVWVLGSNVLDYYQQSLHEIMASWGYAVIVPEARPLTFTDFQYHRRNTDLAKQAIDLAIAGQLGVTVDESRVGIGGYSIGGTMSVFAAAEEPRIDAIVLWAPTSSPFWTGVSPDEKFPLVTQPAFFLLAELDNVEPPDEFPAEMQAKMVQSDTTQYIIPQGLHLYFQQPTEADNAADPPTTITRFEQQGIAIEKTREYLDQQFGIQR